MVRKIFGKKIQWLSSTIIILLVLFGLFSGIGYYLFGWNWLLEAYLGYGAGITLVSVIALIIAGRKKVFKWFG